MCTSVLGARVNIHPLHVNTQLRWLTTFDGKLIISDSYGRSILPDYLDDDDDFSRRLTKVSARVAQAGRIKQSRCLYTRLPLPRTLTWNGYKITQLQRDHELTLGDRRSSSFSPLVIPLFSLFPPILVAPLQHCCREKETKREGPAIEGRGR